MEEVKWRRGNWVRIGNEGRMYKIQAVKKGELMLDTYTITNGKAKLKEQAISFQFSIEGFNNVVSGEVQLSKEPFVPLVKVPKPKQVNHEPKRLEPPPIKQTKLF